MSQPKIKRIAHVVLYVADPEASAAWYEDVLGMRIVTRIADGPYKGGLFLSFGESDHDIALFRAEPGASKGHEFEHIGLELDSSSIDDLRRFYARFQAKKVKVQEILNHGVSVGIYFFDPDGHMLEVLHQVTPRDGGAAIAELSANEGMAEPYELEPLAD
jgi:catechol 2,3-dioxygenase-like lactoylglutathione lyase family enzyme